MLQVEQATRCFGRRTALAEVSFTAEAGEIVGVLGPNGAGKTTLLRVAAGYLQPTRGSVRFNGLDPLRGGVAYRRALGYLPERCPLYDDMTVGEYLRFRARLKGLPFLRARGRVRDLSAHLGLTDMQGRLLGGLSLGTRRRVGVADALLHDPRLLLLDDPFGNVDAEETRRVAAAIAAASRHATALVSGHALASLAALCTRFLVLRGGRVAADTSRAALQARAGAVTVIAEISGAAETALQRLAARFAPDAPATVRLLPDGWWRLSWEAAPGGSEVRDAVAGEVIRQGWRLRAVDVMRPQLEGLLADLVAGRGDGAAPGRTA